MLRQFCHCDILKLEVAGLLNCNKLQDCPREELMGSEGILPLMGSPMRHGCVAVNVLCRAFDCLSHTVVFKS